MSVYNDLIDNPKFSNLSKIIKHANKYIVRIAEKECMDYLDRENIKDLISLSVMVALSEHLEKIPDKWKEHVEWFKRKYRE